MVMMVMAVVVAVVAIVVVGSLLLLSVIVLVGEGGRLRIGFGTRESSSLPCSFSRILARCPSGSLFTKRKGADVYRTHRKRLVTSCSSLSRSL